MASRPDRTPSTRPRGRGRPALITLVLVLAAAGAVLTGCGGDDRGGTSGSGTALEGITREQPLDLGGRSLPEVRADGTTAPFELHAPRGGLLFLAFGYTNCPDVCPTTLYDVRKALAELGRDADRVEVAFATVDPERDTPDVMTAYLGSFVDGGHPLRTERPAELHAVQEVLGITSQVVKAEDGSVEVSHTARSFVVDDRGRVAVEWSFGTTYEAMAHDLRILLQRSDP